MAAPAGERVGSGRGRPRRGGGGMPPLSFPGRSGAAGRREPRRAGKPRPPGLPARRAAESCRPQMRGKREYEGWRCGGERRRGPGRRDPAARPRAGALTVLPAHPRPGFPPEAPGGTGGAHRTRAPPGAWLSRAAQGREPVRHSRGPRGPQRGPSILGETGTTQHRDGGAAG